MAGATLAVAAVFRTARRGVQDVVDRRFNRRKYDAITTIERFSAQLRSELDVETLKRELIAIVDRTMQPTNTVSLWLSLPNRDHQR